MAQMPVASLPEATEVLIIGAGPAGSTLATLLAAAGHPPLVLERRVEAYEHVGELVLPSVNAILHRMGLLDTVDAEGFVRRAGIAWAGSCAAPTSALSIRTADFPPPRALRRYGFNVERSVFDELLLQQAERAGARLCRGVTVDRVVFEADRAVAVDVTDAGAERRRVSSHLVVDASGRRSVLAAQLRLKVRGAVNGRHAMYSWFEGAPPSDVDDGFAVVRSLGGDGAWMWQIPLRRGTTSIGLVLNRGKVGRHDSERDHAFREATASVRSLAMQLADTRRVQPWSVTGNYSYDVRQVTGTGWMVIGDAAGFVDPIFASGVDIAMHSAFFAYQALLPLLHLSRWSREDERFQMHEYEERLRRGLAIWRRLVGAFYQRPSDMWCLASQTEHLPSVARVLQGNPYELQNLQIADELLSCL